MKKLFLIMTIAAIATAAHAQRQTFNLPAYFATNVFLSDDTNTPLHTRIQGIEATNAPSAGVTNIGFGLTGDGQATALAVDTNSVVTTNALVGFVTPVVDAAIAAIAVSNLNPIVWSNTPVIYVGTNHGQMINASVETATALHIPPIRELLSGVPTYNRSQRIAFHSFAPDGVTVTSATLFVDSGTNLRFNASSTPAAQAGFNVYHSGLFSISSYITLSAANSNYWRQTTAPTGATAFGTSGQMAVSGTNLFIYSPNALGVGTARWLRVNAEAAW